MKQVPRAEELQLDADGRLRRHGVALEMNPFCRRAVSKGVELARETAGRCTVFTLGPPSAEAVLREAIAWGADAGVHLCDEAFAGSDTLATARALAGALRREGPFDLVLVGRNSIDGDTGQVGPEVAQLCDLAFAGAVRRVVLAGARANLELEEDDGTAEAEVGLPALLAVAERLCEPCKVDEDGRAAVAAERIRRLSASELGPGPWGARGSPTTVGAVRALPHQREGRVLRGPPAQQVRAAVALVASRVSSGEDPGWRRAPEGSAPPVVAGDSGGRPVAVVLERDRPRINAELLGAAAGLAGGGGSPVWGFWPCDGVDTDRAVPPAGPDELVELMAAGGGLEAEDVAAAVATWAAGARPWLLLAPSTVFGREVAARVAATLGSGLVGDAIGIAVDAGAIVAAKPAFAGALVADIGCTSDCTMVTVRPGVLPVDGRGDALAARRGNRRRIEIDPRGRVRRLGARRNDDVDVLARADVVIGVGSAVDPDEYSLLSPLASVLGAELAATRKVVDKGWAPKSRQVGVTGRIIQPSLYVAIGLRGTFNHMVGVRGAGTILAVNSDESAPVFGHADVGITGDWHEVVPLLVRELRDRQLSFGPAVASV